MTNNIHNLISDDERNRAVVKLTQDLGHPVLNRLWPHQIEFLIQHEVMHERVRQHIVHSLATSNISDPNDEA
jgi:hypothetical protein